MSLPVYAISCRTAQEQITAQWGVSSQPNISKQLAAFGGNLRRERVSRNVTQERLAELADLNIRTIQKIEAGETNILLTTAHRIQRALKCPWESLMPS